MKEETEWTSIAEITAFRVTRARAAAFCASGLMIPAKAPKHRDLKQNMQPNKKRAALGENSSMTSDAKCAQTKKRAVLKDVSNLCRGNSRGNYINEAKNQIKNVKQFKSGQLKVSKVAHTVIERVALVQANDGAKVVHEIGNTKDVKEEDVPPPSVGENVPSLLKIESNVREIGPAGCQFGNERFAMASQLQSPLEEVNAAKKGGYYGKLMPTSNPNIKDIDFDHSDPQLCSLYASEIYNSSRVAELIRRPCPEFMEKIQGDVTDAMRAILVDWLVEVSEEYKLVPDTLYLTVYFIDLFLSQNYIERQRLQLLGITCLLIASKYEEISAPHVEEFCFITDSTYTPREVLKMESRVLNCFAFQLSAPTTQTFLRRFLRAAQATYKNPSLELEYLANYLAELSLMEYSFLNYLPSIIAATAVFLARWTLDQSGHPWNPTLEHYTAYSAPDLKTAAFALQDLQLNTKGCPLNAIRAKYRQEKFKAVATLSSPKLLQTLFQSSKI